MPKLHPVSAQAMSFGTQPRSESGGTVAAPLWGEDWRGARPAGMIAA